jgi:hypothetical protein
VEELKVGCCNVEIPGDALHTPTASYKIPQSFTRAWSNPALFFRIYAKMRTRFFKSFGTMSKETLGKIVVLKCWIEKRCRVVHKKPAAGLAKRPLRVTQSGEMRY